MSHTWFEPAPEPGTQVDGKQQRLRNEGAKRMGAHEKVSNKIDDVAGKAKEAVGKVTGDKDTRAEGKVDQAKSSLKDAGEKVKDAFKK